MYTEFAKKKVFLTTNLSSSFSLPVIMAAKKYRSQNATLRLTLRRVKLDHYCLLATSIDGISHVTFPAFHFSIVSYMRRLYQIHGKYCFSIATKQ